MDVFYCCAQLALFTYMYPTFYEHNSVQFLEIKKYVLCHLKSKILIYGLIVPTSSPVTHRDQQQSSDFTFTARPASRLPKTSGCLSNILYTSTAHQMSYGKYSGLTQSWVAWLPVKHRAGTANSKADFGNRDKKHETKHTMLLLHRILYNECIYHYFQAHMMLQVLCTAINNP